MLTAPLPLAGWGISFMMSLSTGAGVGLLLHRQMKLKYQGSTVLGELQRRRNELRAATEAAGFQGVGAVGGNSREEPVYMITSKDKAM
jgi:hypothetical protein